MRFMKKSPQGTLKACEAERCMGRQGKPGDFLEGSRHENHGWLILCFFLLLSSYLTALHPRFITYV